MGGPLRMEAFGLFTAFLAAVVVFFTAFLDFFAAFFRESALRAPFVGFFEVLLIGRHMR